MDSIKTNKKVSIIAAIYKSEPFLDVLINSVLQQTYTNFELILVDDGSPDRSGEICEKYAKNDKRIIVLHKENGGTSSARNAGLKVVTGDYLTFIDGDDWYEPDYLEYFVKLLEENDCDMAMSDRITSTMNPEQKKRDCVKVENTIGAICDIFYVKVPVGCWNKIYKMGIISQNHISFANMWFGEGLLFSALAAQYSSKIAIGQRKVYGYRKNNPNSGTTMRKVSDGLNALNNSIFAAEQITIRDKKIDRATKWHIWKNHFNLLCYIIGAKSCRENNAETKLALKGIRKNGFSVFLLSKICMKQRLFVLMIYLFPRLTAKLVIKVKNDRYKKAIKDLN